MSRSFAANWPVGATGNAATVALAATAARAALSSGVAGCPANPGAGIAAHQAVASSQTHRRKTYFSWNIKAKATPLGPAGAEAHDDRHGHSRGWWLVELETGEDLVLDSGIELRISRRSLDLGPRDSPRAIRPKANLNLEGG